VDRLEADARVGSLLGEPSEEHVQLGADSFGGADPQLALLAADQRGCGGGELVARAQRPAGGRKQLGACPGQDDVVARAFKQHDAKLPLEATNELTDGRLDDPQVRSGATEVELIRNRHEGRKLA
jgi:hypothetical protein